MDRQLNYRQNMKRILILTTALCALCLTCFNLKAQENTTYFFRVIVTTSPDEGGTPLAYLPVYLSRKEAPDKIIAVRMTDRIGQAWFIDVPIDIYKDYIFTLPFKDGELRYLNPGYTKEPSFKGGNADNPILVDAGMQWETSVEKTPGTDIGKLSTLDWLLKEFPNIAIDGANFYDKKSEATLQLLINGTIPDGTDMAKMVKILQKNPAKNVESAKLSLLINGGDYFAGAIDITLRGMGKPEPAPPFSSSLPLYEN